MIKDNKKLNPFIGIGIGVFLTFFGVFGMLSIFGDILSEGSYIIAIFPFSLVGVHFLGLNASYLRIRITARKLDESAIMMNSMTFFSGNYIITKIRTVCDLYIIKFSDNYLHVLRMNDKTNVSVSWFRRLLGPKLPTSLPLKCPVITEFNNYKIRKCEGNAVLYDMDENKWFSGQTTMFSIFFPSKSMTDLLHPDILQNLINLIDQST